MDRQLPFRAEYAKSGRAACKACKQPIEKDSLRLALMVQSRFFDGMQPNWHHFTCFFGKARPKDVGEIAHFESLRWEDQEKIRKKIGSSSNSSNGVAQSKGKKRGATDAPADLADYTVEYAKSSRSRCKVCEDFIPKDEVRISKKDYESETAMQYGPTERWHHVECFIKAREELGYFASVSSLPGFMALSPEDQKMLKSKIQPIVLTNTTEVDGPSTSKKVKEDKTEMNQMKAQNKGMFKYRDSLQELNKSELTELFEYNKQRVPEGVPSMLDRLSDIMFFGSLSPCKKCRGQLVFRSGFGYQCTGHISEWAKCEDVVSKPARVTFKVPKHLKDEYPFLAGYKEKVKERIFTVSSLAAGTSKAETGNRPMLDSLQFVIHKTTTKSAPEIKAKIEKLGGQVAKKFSDQVLAVISTEGEVNKSKLVKIIKSASESSVPVLPENFFDDITTSTSREELLKKFNERKISTWESDIESKIPERKPSTVNSVYPSKSVYPQRSELFKSNKSVAKVTVKDGLAVDPDSKLDKVAHVYRKNKDIYSIVLSLTDIQSGKNSFYKMQVLESDNYNKYWLFRSWGRIGTTIGGNKLNDFRSLQECVDLFKYHFEEKTGNMWDNRNNFEKRPGKMLMLEVTYGGEEKLPRSLKAEGDVKSSLPKPVQDLITLIFDVEQMKKTMMEFELDLNKMPLGKISQKQILEAFNVLTELQRLSSRSGNDTLVLSNTNRFYTLVPHDFGVNIPPLLNNDHVINTKIDMLNNMMDIEIAYNILQTDDKTGNVIESHYSKLKADICVVDADSEEFELIKRYVQNTHAKTHSNYSLDIEQVFKIQRKGEQSRFKKFEKLGNKKLLWHGSRTTNYAGILSQGLRIAPPEAPVTGYMFGKGVYFADMVSKSANYCMTSNKHNTGLILLCEVALGETHELTQAEYVEKLPPGKHSVKGIGKTHPDPSEKAITPTGAEVPLGKAVESGTDNTSLLYNEYIVYDVAQVKMQYLLRLKFNFRK